MSTHGRSTGPDRPATEKDPARLLLIGGIGRSGSTLLDRLLGQIPGHVSVGELCVRLWDRCIAHDWPCGCGRSFLSCPFWTDVGERAFNGWENVNLPEVIKLQRAVNRTQKVPMLLVPSVVPGLQETLDRYLGYLTRVYAAIREVSGAEVIVDSSKAPSVPYMLRQAEGLDVTIAHVVRDPRGVAYSWTKAKSHRNEQTGHHEPAYIATIEPRKVARRWMTINLMIAPLPRLGVPVIRLRYEDFIRRPDQELVRVARALGEDIGPGDLSFVRPGEVELRQCHTASGNPNRFDDGWVPLRVDEAWRTALPDRDRRTVEVITAPLRAAYGYRP